MVVEDDILITDEIFLLKPRQLDPKKIGYQNTTGFASPANTHFKRAIDLNDICVINKDATYFFKMTTEAMKGLEIRKGDRLIVDSEHEVVDDAIIISWVQGGYRVRQVKFCDHYLILYPANPEYTAIHVYEGDQFHFFGVVTYVIKGVLP
ncbi:S24 family peptidase [Spirosoma sp. 48-14]|mgnify:CR=1 FL=1|jgi:DNA polymerase V|uniref:S24 family peptidase n=1 Tax=Spirosoma sp. 48-14 TaxID=1895854 RepID=UPI00095FD166|nr:S24 family peptidase [Spirosoma sp. 48-14]OJW72957.1 MAG: hypothetical protein BGO59_09475 [Spirosoma sp. 48-14]